MDFKEFKSAICKEHCKRTAKVTNSFGVYDAYKYIRKNNWFGIGRNLKEHEFYSIIRKINLLLADELANGNTVKFPFKMGKLELRKTERGASIVNGKLRVTYPIDWGSTIRLWYEDEEARKNRTKLRYEDKYGYRIKYNKHDAVYENMSFYEFVLNVYIKKSLQNNINARKIDALW
jgi:hypothetical protein